MIGKVLKLFITNNNIEKTRISMTSVDVDALGVLGDKFYNQNSQRSILITSAESYKITQENNIDIGEGSLGENILIDISPYHLVAGDEIRIGKTLFQITQNGTLCKGLSSVHSKLPKLLKHDRGVFAKVVKNEGKISLDDSVTIFKSKI